MAMNQRQTIEDVKKKSERNTSKRIAEYNEALAAQNANDEAQEATNKTKK